MSKLAKSTFPAGTKGDDFECFGPPAVRDGEFENVKICDMGCFTQEGVDSNKYYHAAVVKHRPTGKWYVYFEWGRVGASNPQFQFIECSSEAEAQREFSAQLHSKNDKRGQWVTIAGLRTLQAKPGKDCYLVRPQATRSTGLPDARKIKLNEGAKVAAIPKSNGTKKKSYDIDKQTIALMRDLNVATVQYTKGSMADESLPTQQAIDDARQILIEAQKRLVKVGDSVDDQVKDVDIKEFTRQIYSRIPKKKDRNADASTWILSKNNIVLWQQDLDAFESALYSDTGVEEMEDHPFGGMNISIKWLDPSTDLTAQFIYGWLPRATRNKHSHIGDMRIKNVWEVNRFDEPKGFESNLINLERELKENKIKERPLHQDRKRPDLSDEQKKQYWNTNTNLLMHGSRSVNISGILRTGFRFPSELVNVVISGAMFSGAGAIYTADDWKKSAGYTSLPGSYWSGGGGGVKGRGAFMFLCDVCLGVPHVAPGPYPFVRPPTGTHCIFGKAGYSQVQNNEWIIFNKNQQKLRYLVEFAA